MDDGIYTVWGHQPLAGQEPPRPSPITKPLRAIGAGLGMLFAMLSMLFDPRR